MSIASTGAEGSLKRARPEEALEEAHDESGEQQTKKARLDRDGKVSQIHDLSLSGTLPETLPVQKYPNVAQHVRQIPDKKRGREEELSELPEAKRARPDPLGELQRCLEAYLNGTCRLSVVLEEVFKDPSNKAMMKEAANLIVNEMNIAQREKGVLSKIRDIGSIFFGSLRTGDPEMLKAFAEVLQQRIESNKAEKPRPQKYTDEEFYDYMPLNLYTFLDPLCRGVSKVFDKPEYQSRKAGFIHSANEVDVAIKKSADSLYPLEFSGKSPMRERHYLHCFKHHLTKEVR